MAKKKKKSRPKHKVGRRAFLTAAGSGAAAAVMLRVPPTSQGRTFNPMLIRPPGAVAESEFLAKCVRCGECMKVCPTNAIHPTTLEAGLVGIWSPMMLMSVGYCEFNCTLCGQVCPTGAIEELTVEEKQAVVIGIAHIDRSRCLPFAFDRECIVCEEHCPLEEKAIWFREVTLINHAGEEVYLQQPQVDAETCIGCGICEEKCPVNDPAAIRVTSGGETRNYENQFLLDIGSPYGD